MRTAAYSALKKSVRPLTVGLLVSGWAIFFTLRTPLDAQQAARIPRIGYVSGTGNATNPGPYVEALRQGLRDLGYAEGKNFLIEYRGADGKAEQLSNLVTELIKLKVDVLVVPTTSTARTAKQATKTIPIVMITPGDPVAAGIVDSLAHPGGNITGVSTLSRELMVSDWSCFTKLSHDCLALESCCIWTRRAQLIV